MTRVVLLSMVLCVLVALVAAQPNPDRVLLKDVTVLTLHNGRMTTGRRVAPLPQLICVGGSAGCTTEALPDVVQCKQVGFDGYDAQWECTANLDSKYRFGEVTVLCEGYDYPDDPYILRGSCALEYKLEKTQVGREADNRNYDYGSYHRGYGESSFGGKLLYIIILAIVLFALYSICYHQPHHPAYQPPPAYANGGVPVGNPMYPQAAPYYQPRPWYSPSSFLGGAFLGGMLGRTFGRYGYGGYGYGGYGGYGYPRHGYGRPHNSNSFGGGRASAPSSRPTTGFGGTRRR